jgi:hypothetical protein
MKIKRLALVVSVAAVLATLTGAAKSQSTAYKSDPPVASSAVAVTPAVEELPDMTYVRPTHRTKLNNYIFDTYGPYPITGAALTAGINQFTNSPPEWRQGVEGYSKRLGSNFGIAAITTTTRYGLAEAFKEDTLYYRCECTGIGPRMRHAALSTVTARRGPEGRRVFSLSALVAPYAGTMAAVYGWYPDRFGAKDGFRMGNYNLLVYMGGNMALEFFHSGPHSMLSRIHMDSKHDAEASQDATDKEPTQ